MTHRLDDDARVVTWTEQREITIGYADCAVCGTETPEPTTERQVQFAQSERGGFMWPDRNELGCKPPGWEWDRCGWLCPECRAAKDAALAARRKPDGPE